MKRPAGLVQDHDKCPEKVGQTISCATGQHRQCARYADEFYSCWKTCKCRCHRALRTVKRMRQQGKV